MQQVPPAEGSDEALPPPDPGSLQDALTECDREPIQTPGAIQPNGALLVTEPVSGRVTMVSANLGSFLGIEAAAALGQPLAAVLGDEVAALLPNAANARRANPVYTGLNAGIAGNRVRLLPFIAASGAICTDIIHEPWPDPGEAALGQAQRVMQSLRQSRGSVGLCRIAVTEVRRITGFGRAMVYRFDDDGSGEVVAESLAAGNDSFLGLKYPASDIPRQARRLYLLQRVRVIPDVNATPAALLALPGQDIAGLDLSASSIRAVSPVHLQYLRNMGVTATAVVSLIVGGRLWGMLVCHHDEPRQVGADMRALLDLIGQVMSVLLGLLADAEADAARARRHHALGAIAAAAAKEDNTLDVALAASATALMDSVGAAGAIATIGDRTIAVGSTPAPAMLRMIMAAVAARTVDDLYATSTLPAICPPASDDLAGALYLPLPNCDGGSILWLRQGLNQTVSWAGNPAKLTADPVTGRLEPRQSFAAWNEEVRGRSEMWTEADLKAARDVRDVLDKAQTRRNERALMRRLRENDSLTGLANRQTLENRAEVISGLQLPRPAALAVVNIDRFHKIKELLGPDGAAAVLVQVANRLRVAAGPGEMVARTGPDEFAVLSETGDSTDVAARVFAAFDQPIDIGRHAVRVTVSLGVADTTACQGSGAGLVGAAEAAMRQARTDGGHSISVFQRSRHAEASRRMVLEHHLETAVRLHTDQFHLAFQPILGVATGGLVSWEVLLRWAHPVLGDVSPAVFIPIAESCGSIIALGDLVLRKALHYLMEPPPAMTLEDRDAYLSVNVSPIQLTRPGFASDLAEMLHMQGIQPSRLCIEITEGVFTSDEAVAALNDIRRLGVLVAVDDFGIGYSSLSALRRLSADVVKLDRSFLPRDDVRTASDDAFLAAVVALAHTAGLKVIIEGVETRRQLDAAVMSGADAVQGFLLARPMNGEGVAVLSAQEPDDRSWSATLDAARRFTAVARLRT